MVQAPGVVREGGSRVQERKGPLPLADCGLPHQAIPDWSALRDEGYVLGPCPGGHRRRQRSRRHVDGVLLRKLADQCGLTAALDGAPTLKGRFSQLDQAVLLAEVARVRQVCYPQRQLHSRPADPDCTSYSPASGCPACTSATSTGTTELSGLSHPAPATRTITDPDRTAHLDVRRRDVPAPAAPCQL
jgi:hypothetical protein